jgi:hypothetical protein
MRPIYAKRQAIQDREEFKVVCLYGFPSATLFSIEEEEMEEDLISLGVRYLM